MSEPVVILVVLLLSFLAALAGIGLAWLVGQRSLRREAARDLARVVEELNGHQSAILLETRAHLARMLESAQAEEKAGLERRWAEQRACLPPSRWAEREMEALDGLYRRLVKVTQVMDARTFDRNGSAYVAVWVAHDDLAEWLEQNRLCIPEEIASVVDADAGRLSVLLVDLEEHASEDRRAQLAQMRERFRSSLDRIRDRARGLLDGAA